MPVKPQSFFYDWTTVVAHGGASSSWETREKDKEDMQDAPPLAKSGTVLYPEQQFLCDVCRRGV